MGQYTKHDARYMTDRDAAIEGLKQRKLHRPKRKNNDNLPAGSPIYFYCEICGWESDRVKEDYDPLFYRPNRTCDDCARAIARGYLLKGNVIAIKELIEKKKEAR